MRPMRLGVLLAAALTLSLTACGNRPTVNDGFVRDASGAEATLRPQQPAAPTTTAAKPPPTWGQRYTWDDGLAIEVTSPAPCKPGKYAAPTGIKRAVKFTVMIINGSKEPISAALLSGGDAQFAGRKAEMVFDTDGPCRAGGLESATVLPGKTYSYDVAYAVDLAPGEMQLSFEPHFGGDEAVYVGQA